MSFPATRIRCLGCDFDGAVYHRPIRLIYSLRTVASLKHIETMGGVRGARTCATSNKRWTYRHSEARLHAWNPRADWLAYLRPCFEAAAENRPPPS